LRPIVVCRHSQQPPFSIALVVSVLHCASSALGSGYWFDEVYMLAIGRYRLEWGSADQPPAAPALAALMDAVAPGSHLTLALLPHWRRAAQSCSPG
jgi:hypothetical protein